MSLSLLLDRTVTLRPMNGAVTRYRYNNERHAPGVDVPGVRARRALLAAEEDVVDRDQQARTWLYFLEPEAAALALSGRDRIVDGDDVLEVLGAPEVVRRRFRVHHVEARARIVEG